MNKCFYVYGIPASTHSNKGQSFDNEIMTHVYAMYGIEQSTTMLYILWNTEPYIDWSTQVTTKGQKSNCHYMYHVWYLHIMSCHIVLPATSLMSWCLGAKHQPFAIQAWAGKLWWQLFSKQVCMVIQQYRLILAVNRLTWKWIKHSAKRSVSWEGGKALNIPLDNLVLLHECYFLSVLRLSILGLILWGNCWTV